MFPNSPLRGEYFLWSTFGKCVNVTDKKVVGLWMFIFKRILEQILALSFTKRKHCDWFKDVTSNQSTF